MDIAVDDQGRLRPATAASCELSYRCPVCGNAVRLRAGSGRVAHFVHRAGTGDCAARRRHRTGHAGTPVGVGDQLALLATPAAVTVRCDPAPIQAPRAATPPKLRWWQRLTRWGRRRRRPDCRIG